MWKITFTFPCKQEETQHLVKRNMQKSQETGCWKEGIYLDAKRMEAIPKSSVTSLTVSVWIRMVLKYMAQGKTSQMVTSCVVLIQVIFNIYILSQLFLPSSHLCYPKTFLNIVMSEDEWDILFYPTSPPTYQIFEGWMNRYHQHLRVHFFPLLFCFIYGISIGQFLIINKRPIFLTTMKYKSLEKLQLKVSTSKSRYSF